MGEIVVKHFKRVSAGSDAKELVTEIVVETSDTGQFLQRLEESRLTRPCFQTIDMRARVAGECHLYAFNDRIHYLDDISFQMFEQGLHDNNGVYTVGTFEAIVGGDHTLQAQSSAREAAQRRRAEIEQRRLERAQARARELAGDNGRPGMPAPPLVENPDILPLGYFRKRTYQRLQYACPVTLERGNICTEGVTHDISVSGLRVTIRGLTTFAPGQHIQVRFRARGPDTDELPRSRITYRIVSIEPRGDETTLRLSRPDLKTPAGVSQLLESLVETYQGKYKLDVEDEYQSILSWVYERSSAQSVTQLPLFIEQGDSDGLRVQAVAMSEGNAHLARFFCTDADSYDFTPLCLPQRLQQLNEARSYLLAMYRRQGDRDRCRRIYSLADAECASPEDFFRFAAWVLQQQDHCIVKVFVSTVPAVPVADKKIDEVSRTLQRKSDSQPDVLRDRLSRLRLVACVVDVTQTFRAGLGDSPSIDADWPVWVGNECRSGGTDSVRESLSLPVEQLQPELIRFGYAERRREDRYLAETRVEVRFGGGVFKGMSKDISSRGIRILLEECIGARKGVTVKVGLVSLQQKKAVTNLMDIPYRIVNSRDTDAGTELMMERILGGKHEGLKEFFAELIAKNQHKLAIDIGDIWGATIARTYESLLAANLPGVVFFLGRNDAGGAHLQFLGVPEAPGSLMDFFRTPDGLDLRWLNEPRLVTGLFDAVQILLRHTRDAGAAPAPFELEVYVYKEFDTVSGATFIQAASELDFVSAERREAFLARLGDYEDWRCIKLTAAFAQPLDDKALEVLVQSVRTHARHRAIRLSDLVHSLVGYGELVDITPEWKALRAAAGRA